MTTKNGSKRYLAELSVGGKRYKGHRYEQLSDAIAERKAMERKYQQPILLRAKEELRAKEDKVMYKRAKAKIPQDKKYHWIETGIHALHLKSGKVNFSATVRKLSSGRRQVQTFESYSDAKEVTSHAMRHTHASVLIQNGSVLPYVQHRLRHRKLETTINTYVHLIEKTNGTSDQLAMRLMSEGFEK